jgi:gamma-butyrobetaine dioxygenase
LLTRVPLRFHRHSPDEYNLQCESKIISVDQDNNVVGFRFPFRFRAPLDIPSDLIEPTYEAIKNLVKLLFRENFHVQFTLQPGSVLIFDNHRLLHGRTNYSGRRHFRYCYVDRDDFHNRLRLLGGQLGLGDAEMTLPRGALA